MATAPNGRLGALVGSYRLEALIGQGAMGEVWRATHTRGGGAVALKLVNMGADKESVARIRNEARAVRAIDSPHVVKVLDFGYDGGSAFIAMELLTGETLAARLRRVVKLGPVETVSVVRQVALGLAVAHRLGIVHRDLKPDNVFISRNTLGGEDVKILDFGIAKVFADHTNQTQQGVVVGTPAYLSQEQILGTHAVDARTDFWALAIVAFECLTGHLPYDAQTIAELFVQIVGPARDRAVERVNLSPEFKAWFRRATDTDPDERFESGKEFVEELRRALLPNASVSEWELGSSIQLTARPAKRSLLMLVASLVVVTMILSVLAIAAFMRRPTTVPAASTVETPNTTAPTTSPAATVTVVAPEPPSLATVSASAEPSAAVTAEPSAEQAHETTPAKPTSSARPQAPTRRRDRWGLGI